MASDAAHIGVLTLDFFIPLSNSLKQKRRVLLSFKSRMKSKFNISIAEIAAMDKWQKAVIGITMIANEKKVIDSCFQQILHVAKSLDEAELTHETMEFL